MIRTGLAFAFLVMGFALAWPLAEELYAADRCADAGGSLDYSSGRCDYKVSHPSIGMWQRHGHSLFAAFAFGVVGCALLVRRKK